MPVWVEIRLGGRPYRVQLKTRTELDVLVEIGLEDEYAPADSISAQVIVDLGAHVGLGTLRLLAAHPEAQVVAVEADPALIPQLRSNVSAYPVTVVAAAICGTAGPRELYRSSMSNWGNSLTKTVQDQTPVTVTGLTFDELLESERIEHVDLLKLDVEGAEWEMFKEPPPPSIGAIIGEVHGRGELQPEAFLSMLSEALEVKVISAEPGRATFLGTRVTPVPATGITEQSRA